MNHKICVTLGPSSLNKKIISQLESDYIYLFRINLSHAPINSACEDIAKILTCANIPICLDLEGAQIRNQTMNGGE